MATYSESVSVVPAVESSASAVSWGAIFVGAVAAAALSLLLLAIGSGFGLAAISPWQGEGASAESIGIGGALWLAFMQLASASVGGYLAGRLRTKWVQLHTDEVFFRDTAHGFAVWAVGLVLTASVLASATSALVGGVARAGAAGAGATAMVAGSAATAAGVASMQNSGESTGMSGLDPFAYVTDVLLRPADSPTTSSTAGATSGVDGAANTSTPGAAATDESTIAGTATGETSTGTSSASMAAPSAPPGVGTTALENASPDTGTAQTTVAPTERFTVATRAPDAARENATRAEFGRIFARSALDGQLDPTDRTYIASVVADRAGISQAEAAQRVDHAVATLQQAKDKAREAADDARKAAAFTTLWIAVALLIGAFAASYFATVGGRLRDNVRYV